MSLMQINYTPDNKGLKDFGKIALVAAIAIPLLLYFVKGLALQWVAVIFAAGCTIFLSSLISLKLTRLIFIGLTMLTMPIGLVVNFILMSLFYFLLLTPVGLFFRLIGRDALSRKFDSTQKSYWQKHNPPESFERYFRQF